MKEIEKIEASIYLYDCLKEVFEECAVKFMEELKNKLEKKLKNKLKSEKFQILYFNKNEIREIYSDSNVAPGIYLKFNEIKIKDTDYYFTLKIEINTDELCLCFGFDSKIKKEKKEEILPIKLKGMKDILEKFLKLKGMKDILEKLTDLEKKKELKSGDYAFFLNLENTNFRKVSTDNEFLMNLLEDDTREKEVKRVYEEIDKILDMAKLEKISE